MKEKLSLFIILLFSSPFIAFAGEPLVPDCTSLDNFVLNGERSDGVHELRCTDGIRPIIGVDIDYKNQQCIRYVASNSGDIVEKEAVDWPNCHKYRERAAKSSDMGEPKFFLVWYEFLKFKLWFNCRKTSAIQPYSEIVANPALTVHTTATRLEEAGKLPEALEIFQSAENCCVEEDLPLVKNHVAILQAWLGKTEADKARVEKYLLTTEKTSPPMDIVPLLRLFDRQDYWLARDTFFILNANFKEEVENILSSRVPHQNETLEDLQAQAKKMAWRVLATSYLREENEDKFMQIMKAQLGVAKPADQFIALADAYVVLSEGDTQQGEYRSRAIINFQKSLDLHWDKRQGYRMYSLLKLEERLDEAMDLLLLIIKHDRHNMVEEEERRQIKILYNPGRIQAQRRIACK